MQLNPTPKVNCKYGAPMGRRSDTFNNVEEGAKFTLRRVYLNNGGYDAGGAYWGYGAPLYWCAAVDCEGEEVSMYMRAMSRDAAKAFIRQNVANARFYR